MKMIRPIVCLGILVADVVGRPVRVLPAAGRLSLVDEMGLFTGGCAANTGAALAKMGFPVQIIGKVGCDAFGDFLLQTLSGFGVGTSGIQRDPGTGTSATMVMVDPDGERRFVHYLGANARLTLEDVDLALVKAAGILHVAGTLVMPGIDGEPTAWLLKEAQSAGVTTFLDTVWDDTGRWMAVLEPCLPFLDYFIPSLTEAQALTGLAEPEEIARSLLDRGVKTVGIKMGAEGCLVAPADGETIRLPAFKVEAVDATGAGDAFAAGFIAGVWQGWTLEETARLANAVGALCVTGLGAVDGLRTLDETIRFMGDCL